MNKSPTRVNDEPYDKDAFLAALLSSISGVQDSDDSNGMKPVEHAHQIEAEPIYK